MKKLYTLISLLIFLSGLIPNNAQAQFCGTVTMRGMLNPQTITNTVTANSGTIAVWSFMAAQGDIYNFSTCAASEDTKIRIYDENQVLIIEADDDGPHCAGTRASISWTAPTNGMYYVHVANYDCDALTNNAPMNYWFTAGDLYCRSYVDNRDYLFITNVALNSISNSSGSNRYANYTSLSTDVIAGETYNLGVTMNYANSNNLNVWIDLTNDNDFLDAGEQLLISSNNSSIASYNITFPVYATPGNHRVRIQNSYSGYGNAQDPCANIAYGEVEDYTINILPAPIPVAVSPRYINSPCLTNGKPIEITLYNNTGSDRTNFFVYATLTSPTGIITNYTYEYTDILSASTYDIIYDTLVFNEYGDYTFELSDNIVGTPISKKLTNNFYNTHPYYMDNEVDFDESKTWVHGSQFTKNLYSNRITGNINTSDSIYSPVFLISKASQYFQYYINSDNLNAGDSIFVQIRQECNAKFSTIDTVILGHPGKYNRYDNTIFGMDLSSYVNKKVQFKFLVDAESGFTPYVNLEYANVFPGYDFVVENIYFDDFAYNVNDKYRVGVIIRNNGAKTQLNNKVKLTVYGEIPQTLNATISDPIAYNNVDTAIFEVDATMGGTYEFIAEVFAPLDDDISNNTGSNDISLDYVQVLPVELDDDFSENNDPNEVNDDEDVNFYFYQASHQGNYLETDNITRDEYATITSFVFGPIGNNSYLAFDYDIVSYDNGYNLSNEFGLSDMLTLEVSEDYGATFTALEFVDKDAYNENLQYQAFPVCDLSDYEGKTLVFRLRLTNGAANDETQLIGVRMDNLYIGGAELSVTNIISSVDPACGDDDAYFTVQINNNTKVPAINSKVRLEVTGEFFTDTAVEYTFTSIDPNDNAEYSFGPFNINSYGEYQLNAQLFNEEDYEDGNNQMYDDFTVFAPSEIPYVQDFNSDPNWSYENAHYNTTNVRTDRIAFNTVASFTTGKIGTISTGDFLVFDYLTYAYDISYNTLGYYIRQEDSIVVYLSENCGISWTKIHKITSHANIEEYESTSKINLTAFAGKDARFRISLYKNNEEGRARLYVDNFHVISTGDVSISSVEFPQYINNVAICGTATEEAMVVLQNNSSNQVSNIPVLLYSVYNDDTTKIESIYTGTIEAYSQDTMYISGFNSVEAGDYEIIAISMLEGDLDETNDENSGNYLTVQSLATVPYNYNGASKPAIWQYFPEDIDWFSNVDISASGESYLVTRYLTDAETAFVTFQKLGPIRTGYVLRMNYNLYTYDDDNTLLGNYFREGDKLEIQISDNCGQTFTTIQTMDMNNHLNSPDDMSLALALEAYANKEIAVRLQIVKGSDIGQIRFALNQLDVTIPAADMALSQIFVEKEVCGKAAQEVFAVVSNNSTFESITGFNISALVTVNNVVFDNIVYNYTATLNPGEVDTVMIGTFNSETPNDYEIDALISYSEDVNNTNDDADFDFTIYEMLAVPYENNFYYAPDNWLAKENVYYNSWDKFYTNSLYPGDMAILYSPKFENITISSQLEFDFAEFNEFAIGDKLEVYISTDCGASWDLLHTIANSDNLTDFKVERQIASLAAYTGEDIIVKFEFSNVNGNSYYASIDNFEINHTDIAILGIVNQTDKFDINTYNENSGTFNFSERYITCGSATDSVFVVIENQGTSDVNSVDIKLETTGKEMYTLTGTFTGLLEPGDRAWMYLGDLNTLTPGLLDMRASIIVAQDANSLNDTTGFSVTTQETFDMPYNPFTSGWFNETAYWKYDNDGKMAHDGYSTIYTPSQLIQDEVAYAISPKVNAEESTWLYFNYNVYNSLGEGHIIHDEVLNVSVISNCSGTKTEVWRMDVNSTDYTNRGTIAIDLSTYAGSEIQVVFQASKGNSEGAFYASLNNIHFWEIAPTSFTLSSQDELFTETNGVEICEEAYYSIYNQNVEAASMSYRYSFANADTSYVISENSYFNGYMKDYNSGTFTQEAWYSTNPSIVFTSNIDVTVYPMPTLPVITGDEEVLSNVGTTVYTLTGEHADEYVWDIYGGGQISGNTSATVVWYEGFIGVTYVTATGLNQCGYGEEASLMVRVDYLDPEAGSNVADLKGNENTATNNENAFISAYPNPSNGQFIVNLPEGINHGIMIIKNNLGLEISKSTITSNKQEVSLAETNPGVYFITVITMEKVYSMPIIIE